MKKIGLIVSLITITLNSCSQKADLRAKLYKLEGEIINGNIESLKELAKYIDDKRFVQEFLGYHNYPNTARGVTIRILQENCLFTEGELKIDSTISAVRFLKILNSQKLAFDDLTGMFLITPIESRKVNYQLKQLSAFDLKHIDTTVIKSPYPGWYYENQVDGFLVTKNPEALKWIASAWYKNRSRFNRHYFNEEEFLDLIKKLTHIEVGVPDGHLKTTFLYKDDYYAIARLNYLAYWANHFQDYKWNEQEQYFENIKERGGAKSKEEVLFSLLNSENDFVAIDAFTQLTELDTGKVKVLSDEYEKNRMDANYRIPTFPYRFLEQIVILTQYCRDNGIKYKAEGWVLDSLEKLKTTMTYPERYRLENNVIGKLSLNEVTSVEYYGLINEKEWDLTYSLGRILDKFYSQKLETLVSDERQLALFLKKAVLFGRIGIVGICNKYLNKFQNTTPVSFTKIQAIFKSNRDNDIRSGAKKVIDAYRPGRSAVSGKNIPRDKIKKLGVAGFKEKYQAILRNCKDEFDCQSKVSEQLGRINYAQLGFVMRILAKDTLLTKDELGDIINNDFGIETSSIEEFLKAYDSKNEHDVYEYYFRENGIDYLDGQGNFMYEKVFETLKYDIVDAFVGGGGGRREKGIYPFIKLLELKFKTTLGFSEKLCDAGSPGLICGPAERARSWMQFLLEKKLVGHNKTEAVSISD